MDVRCIVASGGGRLAVIPEADDRALIAAGEEEMIPVEYVNRMIDGENKIRTPRT
jgi:hypothetical protein